MKPIQASTTQLLEGARERADTPERQRRRQRGQAVNRKVATCKSGNKIWRQNEVKDAVSLKLLDLSDGESLLAIRPSLVSNQLELGLGLPLKKQNIPSTWRSAGDKVKLLHTQHVLEQQGTAYSFSLHLSDEVRASFEQQSKTGDNSFNTLVLRKVQRTFKKHQWESPLFWFVSEQSPNNETGELGVIHVHGAVSIPPEKTIDEARAILKAVGGQITTPNFKKRQLVMKEITSGKGWVDYSLKDLGLTQDLIKGKLLTISGEAKKRSRAVYESLRGDAIALLEQLLDLK